MNGIPLAEFSLNAEFVISPYITDYSLFAKYNNNTKTKKQINKEYFQGYNLDHSQHHLYNYQPIY